MNKHYIVFRGFDEDDDGYDYDVEHPDDCPKTEWYWGEDYSCNVAVELVNMGSDAFGVWDNELKSLEPGRYEIEWWMEVHRTWETTEYSSGLTVVGRVEE